jgi:hypothetical protein
MSSFRRGAGWVLVLTAAACARSSGGASATTKPAPVPAPVPSVADVAAERDIRRTLEALYAAFSFDAGAEPDWAAQRALFLPGAAFVDPVRPRTAPRAIGADEFLANFRRWVTTDSTLRDGFRERIVALRVDHFDHVAHAYVTFEGFVPRPGVTTPPVRTRGVDSVQLVRDDHGTWRVASFTTQYEGPGALLPARFGGRPDV